MATMITDDKIAASRRRTAELVAKKRRQDVARFTELGRRFAAQFDSLDDAFARMAAVEAERSTTPAPPPVPRRIVADETMESAQLNDESSSPWGQVSS